MRSTFLFLFCCLFYTIAQGQTVDSTGKSVAFALARYEALNNNPERLYNGVEYISYDRRLTGHSFFASDSMQNGSIQANGQVFALPLLYDIVRDEVVLAHPTGYRMALLSDRIQGFSVQGHTFIRVDSTQQGLPTGFYDLLYNGPTQLVAHHTKAIVINPSANGTYGVFDPKTTYYIKKSGRFYPIKNKKTLFVVLENNKKQLTAFTRKEKLKFKQDIGTTFIKLAKANDELTQSL
ncbi:hypothetical protein J2I47_09660 [Fibrella sp. HMF5335]|uniref:WG containing repeat-containing protein n=1 Tax=Fibrella rubiginis TaxID=2817060 RepID=A0A939GFF6_9BACT|nr:hypothetical protein [Fibrella rubiginis]MBO0936808.1 hypothetical protein [Fibrella rubiginis]